MGNQCLGVAQQQSLESSTLREFRLQHLRLHLESAAGALHHGAVGHRATAHKQRDANHAIIAGQTHFCARAILHRVQQSNYRGRREKDVIQLGSESVNDFAQRKRNRL